MAIPIQSRGGNDVVQGASRVAVSAIHARQTFACSRRAKTVRVEMSTTAPAERFLSTRSAEDCRSDDSTVSAFEVSGATYNIQE